MTSKTLEGLRERERSVLMGNYGRQPLALEEGHGCTVRDVDGREYLDMVGGLAVNVLGHSHPDVARALSEQSERLVHTSNLYTIEEQVAAAEKLVATAFPSRVLFCNSGTEANEAAIKIARKWGRLHRNGATTIIVAEGAFHGRTLGALAATGNARYREPFEPLPGGFVRVPYDDAEAVAAAIDDSVCAVMMEPIEGESGVVPMRDETLRDIRRICDQHDVLLILDEVQTGMGRTGRWWAHQHAGITPDVMTVAKGLGGGVPVGAVLASPRADVLEPGDHGCTFGGSPLVCSVVQAVLAAVERQGLVANAEKEGERLARGLASLKERGLPVDGVRGRGLMLAVTLSQPIAAAVGRAALEHGLIVNPIGERVIRLVPPLVITDAEVDEAVERLAAALAGAAEQAS